MIRQLVLTLILSLWGALAFAQTQAPPEPTKSKFELLPKDIYFQPGGGLRVRYENLRNATGGASPQNEDESQTTHRAQFDIRLYKGEYVETFFRFINFADWGAANGDASGGQHDGFTRTNGLLVNQAWGLWKVYDSLGLRFGRMPLHLGLGYTYGGNDWFNVPYSFDLFNFNFDWESVNLKLIAAKVQEFSRIDGETLSSDPEENHFIISFDIRNIADFVNVFTFNFVQVNRDLGSPDGGVSVLNGLNMQRLALEMGMKGRNFFGSTFFSYITGEEKIAPSNRSVGSNLEKNELKQTAFDMKLGYRLADLSNLAFWAGYHYDSGDKTPDDGISGSYDSFYYEVYGQSGVMDLIRWGNLSMFRLGADIDLAIDLTLGAEWLKMSRSQGQDNIHFGQAGRYYQQLIDSNELTLANDKDIGTEFDLWLNYSFQSGVKIRGTISAFFPGASFAGATTTTGNGADRAFFQFLTQVGYFF